MKADSARCWIQACLLQVSRTRGESFLAPFFFRSLLIGAAPAAGWHNPHNGMSPATRRPIYANESFDRRLAKRYHRACTAKTTNPAFADKKGIPLSLVPSHVVVRKIRRLQFLLLDRRVRGSAGLPRTSSKRNHCARVRALGTNAQRDLVIVRRHYFPRGSYSGFRGPGIRWSTCWRLFYVGIVYRSNGGMHVWCAPTSVSIRVPG